MVVDGAAARIADFEARQVVVADGGSTTVTVVKKAAWPRTPWVYRSLCVPAGFQRRMAAAAAAFADNGSRRIETWAWGYGTATLVATLPPHHSVLATVCGTTLQAVVLLAFNAGRTLTLDALKAATHLDTPTLKVVLGSMTATRARILQKSPCVAKIRDTDSFSVDVPTGGHVRLVPPRLPNVDEDADADLKHVVDARIVRTMKAARHMAHDSLVDAVASVGVPRHLVAARVAHTLTNGYISRTGAVYTYVP